LIITSFLIQELIKLDAWPVWDNAGHTDHDDQPAVVNPAVKQIEIFFKKYL
jgi:hypothetical protein